MIYVLSNLSALAFPMPHCDITPNIIKLSNGQQRLVVWRHVYFLLLLFLFLCFQRKIVAQLVVPVCRTGRHDDIAAIQNSTWRALGNQPFSVGHRFTNNSCHLSKSQATCFVPEYETCNGFTHTHTNARSHIP